MIGAVGIASSTSRVCAPSSGAGVRKVFRPDPKRTGKRACGAGPEAWEYRFLAVRCGSSMSCWGVVNTGAHGAPDPGQRALPPRVVVGGEHLGQQVVDFLLGGRPGGPTVVRVRVQAGELRTQRAAELPPELVLERGEREQPSVGRAEDVVVALHEPALQRIPAIGQGQREQGAPAGDRFGEGDVDVLSLSRGGRARERHGQCERRLHRARHVTHPHARPGDLPVDAPGDGEEPGQAEEVQFVAGPVRVRSRLAVSAEGAQDDARVRLAQDGIEESEPVEDAGAVYNCHGLSIS
ncbi:hypothetical protein GCM10009646_62460 [Streptomyces aureus]